MNSYEIIVTSDAEADLYKIKDYIAETLQAPDVALNYIRVIRKQIEKLSYMADSIMLEELYSVLYVCLKAMGMIPIAFTSFDIH